MALPLVPVLVSAGVTAFLTMLASAVPALLGRALLFLGIGFASITGVQAGYDSLLVLVQNELSNMPFAVASILKMAGVPVAMSFIFSALAFKLSLKLLNGTLNFMSRRAPQIT